MRILLALLLCCFGTTCFSQVDIDREVVDLMKRGDIPGLSMVIIKDGKQLIKNYGYANIEHKKPVTSNTLFEIGSCTKAFTALAVMTLVHQQKLSLDDEVSKYIPWLRVQYEGQEQSITIRQLLHHTSGIPWSTIAKIPQSVFV